MSSEIYELMKRSDEVAVVERAHARPRFVEDCVREMLAGVLTRMPGLDGASFVSARQENLETIHQHNVLAERHGLLCELRQEIAAARPCRGTPRWMTGWPPEPSLQPRGLSRAPGVGAGRRSSRVPTATVTSTVA